MEAGKKSLLELKPDKNKIKLSKKKPKKDIFMVPKPSQSVLKNDDETSSDLKLPIDQAN